jgi:hypothetical protein
MTYYFKNDFGYEAAQYSEEDPENTALIALGCTLVTDNNQLCLQKPNSELVVIPLNGWVTKAVNPYANPIVFEVYSSDEFNFKFTVG